jgi:aspartokinase-like uncharacterized kinase
MAAPLAWLESSMGLIAHWIATTALAVSATLYIAELKTDIEVSKKAIANQEQKLSENWLQIDSRLLRMEDKLDRLIERDRR